jgi:hypothetical protein
MESDEIDAEEIDAEEMGALADSYEQTEGLSQDLIRIWSLAISEHTEEDYSLYLHKLISGHFDAVPKEHKENLKKSMIRDLRMKKMTHEMMYNTFVLLNGLIRLSTSRRESEEGTPENDTLVILATTSMPAALAEDMKTLGECSVCCGSSILRKHAWDDTMQAWVLQQMEGAKPRPLELCMAAALAFPWSTHPASKRQLVVYTDAERCVEQTIACQVILARIGLLGVAVKIVVVRATDLEIAQMLRNVYDGLHESHRIEIVQHKK